MYKQVFRSRFPLAVTNVDPREETGRFAVLRRALSSVSDDQRVPVAMIAFCFGALLLQSSSALSWMVP